MHKWTGGCNLLLSSSSSPYCPAPRPNTTSFLLQRIQGTGRLGWKERQIAKRCFSSLSVADGPEAYLSTSTDPYFNLSLEDYLFRSRSKKEHHHPLLLLYRNATCVVLGRNQNPWKEVNTVAMRELGIPLVRRRSGGGTVYHDEGNTNYSIHVPREDFDRATNAELIARALNKPPIHLASHSSSSSSSSSSEQPRRIAAPNNGGVYVNHRNDICVELASSSSSSSAGEHDGTSHERKVSGSAYKLISNRAYHHGTMLLSSDLTSLGSALRNERGESLSTKGIASVRAHVVNLQEAFPERKAWLVHDVFCRAVVQEFMQTYAAKGEERKVEYVGEEMLEREPKLKSGYEEITSWEWTYGSTPEFTHKLTTRRPSGSSPTQQMISPGGEQTDVQRQKGPLFSTPSSSSSSSSNTTFSWGDFDLEINARQGIIQSCHLSNVVIRDHSDSNSEREAALVAFVKSMQGQRYDDYASRPPGTLHGANDEEWIRTREPMHQELLAWLKTAL